MTVLPVPTPLAPALQGGEDSRFSGVINSSARPIICHSRNRRTRHCPGRLKLAVYLICCDFDYMQTQ